MSASKPGEKSHFDIETVAMTKQFDSFVALDDVSIKIKSNSFHALLGENGAGKSTLVKCMMGYYTPTVGQIMINGHEQEITNPKQAHALGLGMVYQHFTLVPCLTAAENLVISRADVPTVIRLRTAADALDDGAEAIMSLLDFPSRAESVALPPRFLRHAEQDLARSTLRPASSAERHSSCSV